MPVWQFFHNQYYKNVEILSIAIDFQGKEKIMPYIEKLDLGFPTLIDQKNITSQLYNFKAVPNGILIDENGKIVSKKIGAFDIRDKVIEKQLVEWITKSNPINLLPNKITDINKEAITLFEKGMMYYESGNIDQALEHWKKSVAIEPSNYIIRKQIWAIENPEKFYSGKIDYNWQNAKFKQTI